jgi:internalin A
MLATKKTSIFLLTLISSVSGLPVVAVSGKLVNTKDFAQWCQYKQLLPVETRKTIDLLLKKVETNNCQLASLKLRKLTSLYLTGNQISDVKPLASLTNLTSLGLDGNQISDVKPLASLTNLEYLFLDENQISDVKPLASLTNLQNLFLGGNQISDVMPLASLTNLEFLTLYKNQVSDVKSLASLINLKLLYLPENQINKKICPVKPELICHF